MDVFKTNPEIFVTGANILKAIAHPQRLCVINTLCEKERINVTDMQDCLGEVQSTVSQHVSKLKAANIIVGRREGTNIFYSIENQELRNTLKELIKVLFNGSNPS